jgi:hypothetical protein
MNAKRRDLKRVMTRIEKAVDRTADAAESIHKRAAQLPLAPFEGMEPLEAALADVRRMQNRAIRAIYDLVRDINHELVRLAQESFAAAEKRTRRPARRKAGRATAVRKAA